MMPLVYSGEFCTDAAEESDGLVREDGPAFCGVHWESGDMCITFIMGLRHQRPDYSASTSFLISHTKGGETPLMKAC